MVILRLCLSSICWPTWQSSRWLNDSQLPELWCYLASSESPVCSCRCHKNKVPLPRYENHPLTWWYVEICTPSMWSKSFQHNCCFVVHNAPYGNDVWSIFCVKRSYFGIFLRTGFTVNLSMLAFLFQSYFNRFVLCAMPRNWEELHQFIFERTPFWKGTTCIVNSKRILFGQVLQLKVLSRHLVSLMIWFAFNELRVV